MPTYQYACTGCGDQLEVVQRFTDDALTTCPACEGRLRKVYSAVGVVFKGSGFYRNDSRAAAKAATNGNGSSSGSDSSSDKASDTASDTASDKADKSKSPNGASKAKKEPATASSAAKPTTSGSPSAA